jgi:hypothetical protein
MGPCVTDTGISGITIFSSDIFRIIHKGTELSMQFSRTCWLLNELEGSFLNKNAGCRGGWSFVLLLVSIRTTEDMFGLFSP